MLFFCGLLFGLIIARSIVVVLDQFLINKKSPKIDTDKMIKNIELLGSIKYRVTQISNITDRQIELASRTERPSASAAHSRYKNDIVGELKSLEEDKITIYRSILKDGIDPELQMIMGGELKTLKMSEVIAIHDGKTDNLKTDPIKSRNNGLHLVTKNEAQNDVTTSNPEIP